MTATTRHKAKAATIITPSVPKPSSKQKPVTPEAKANLKAVEKVTKEALKKSVVGLGTTVMQKKTKAQRLSDLDNGDGAAEAGLARGDVEAVLVTMVKSAPFAAAASTPLLSPEIDAFLAANGVKVRRGKRSNPLGFTNMEGKGNISYAEFKASIVNHVKVVGAKSLRQLGRGGKSTTGVNKASKTRAGTVTGRILKDSIDNLQDASEAAGAAYGPTAALNAGTESASNEGQQEVTGHATSSAGSVAYKSTINARKGRVDPLNAGTNMIANHNSIDGDGDIVMREAGPAETSNDLVRLQDEEPNLREDDAAEEGGRAIGGQQRGTDERGTEERGTGERGTDEHGTDERGTEELDVEEQASQGHSSQGGGARGGGARGGGARGRGGRGGAQRRDGQERDNQERVADDAEVTAIQPVNAQNRELLTPEQRTAHGLTPDAVRMVGPDNMNRTTVYWQGGFVTTLQETKAMTLTSRRVNGYNNLTRYGPDNRKLYNEKLDSCFVAGFQKVHEGRHKVSGHVILVHVSVDGPMEIRSYVSPDLRNKMPDFMKDLERELFDSLLPEVEGKVRERAEVQDKNAKALEKALAEVREDNRWLAANIATMEQECEEMRNFIAEARERKKQKKRETKAGMDKVDG